MNAPPMNHELKLTRDHDLRIAGTYGDESIRFDSMLGLELGTGPGPPSVPSELEEWFSISLAIPRPACTTSPTVDDDSADAPVFVTAGVVASSQPPAPPFVNAFPNHEPKPTHFEDLPNADNTNVGFSAPSKRKTASARGDFVRVARDWPGSPVLYEATFIAIVPVGLSVDINTFGSCGLVRGRLRSLRR